MRDCDLINVFADFIRYGKRRAERTITSYRSDLEQFVDFLISESLTGQGEHAAYFSEKIQQPHKTDQSSVLPNVDSDKVRAFMKYLRNKNYSQASTRRKLATLICFYNFLCSHHRLDFNPIVGVEVPRVEKRKPGILTEEQIHKLPHLPDIINWLGARDKAMLELLCNTGIRVSELVNLDIDDVDFDKQSLRVTSGSGKQRQLNLPLTAIETIRHYLQLVQKQIGSQEKSDRTALFINKFGKRLDTRSADRRIEKYILQAGFDKSVTPFDLRHSFAQKLISNGASDTQLCQLLGFESVCTARSYAELLKSENSQLQNAF
ncbi:MAG: tyrosine-type recombinase/integrase [Phycisphaerae bacterium]|nr:tyrosine-type recombinase/integrase [Phycisphaerae bacterium]